MPASDFRHRKRSDYGFFLPYRTRWSDNDQYSHMNNAVYHHLIDSVVNSYLIAHCGLVPATSPRIGLVVSSFCEYFHPTGFPDVLDLGLRVNKLGNSSVSYEVGVFAQGKDSPSAVGGFTHVFVDRESGKSCPLAEELKDGLRLLHKPSSNTGAKL